MRVFSEFYTADTLGNEVVDPVGCSGDKIRGSLLLDPAFGSRTLPVKGNRPGEDICRGGIVLGVAPTSMIVFWD